EVIADKPIAHGSLGRNRFQRGVTVDGSRRSIEPWIGNSPNSDPAIVVGEILNEPVDGVVGIRAFIDVLGPVLLRQMWAYVHELAFGIVASTDILKDEDVAFFIEPG